MLHNLKKYFVFTLNVFSRFANRAKAIKNNPEVNAVVTADNTMIQRLTKQMYKLQAQLESKKNLEVCVYLYLFTK